MGGQRLGGEIYVSVDDAGNRCDGLFNRVGAIRAVHAANSEALDLFDWRAFENVLRVHGRARPVYRLRRGLDGPPRDHFINKSVLDRLCRRHEVVAVGILLDLLDVLAGMMSKNVVQDFTETQRLARMNLDIAGLPFEAAGDLMDQDSRVRQ